MKAKIIVTDTLH